MDIARLGLAVDSSQVEKGTVELRQLTSAAGQASAASRNLAGASHAEAAGQRAATTAVQSHNAALTAQNALMRSTMHMRTNMIFQLNDVAVSLASGMNPALVAMQQGSQILQYGFAPALKTIGDLAVGLVTKFWPLAAVIGVVSAGITGLTYEINKTANVQVGFFDVALAGWHLFAEGVAAEVEPVFTALGTWLQQGWDAAAPVLKSIGNAIIGTSQAIGIVWATWPSVMGDAIIKTVNVALVGITRLLNEGRTQLLQFLSWVSTLPIPGVNALASAALGMGNKPFEAPQFENQFAGAGDAAGGAISDAMGRDYLGEAFDAISERAQEIAVARKEVEELGDAAKAANDNIWGMTDALTALGPASVDPLTLLRNQMADLDKLLAQGKISWEEYGEAAFRANAGAASSVLGLAGGLTSAMSQMFRDNKAFAIANAVVSTAEAVMKAMATYGPTPWGFAAAGVAAATGAAQIATIMSANPGGGSAGSVRAPAAARVQNAPQRQEAERAPDRMDITLHGLDRNSLYSGDNVEAFLRAIEERAADGRILNIKVA